MWQLIFRKDWKKRGNQISSDSQNDEDERESESERERERV
jgi:hypothetical protein